jgi:hypothetical protein
MRKKALQNEDFPSQAMIDEFLHRQPLPEADFMWKQPDIVSFIVSVNSLTFWHRSITFKFQHTMYVKCK